MNVEILSRLQFAFTVAFHYIYPPLSIPHSIPYTAMEMHRRGHEADTVDGLIDQNPHRLLSQCPKFRI